MLKKTLSIVLAIAFIAAIVPSFNAVVAQDEMGSVRFATFNASLNRSNAGELLTALQTGDDLQIQAVAEIIQTVRPDVLLINEFDYDETAVAYDLFQSNYLGQSINGSEPIEYPYYFAAPSNTGVPSGFDLNGDAATDTADDAYGFGFFPGQYGMVVYSMYPIDTDNVRTFQTFLWKDMPDALLPVNPDTGEGWYSDEILEVFRLSSKSHWDVPVMIGDATVHVLAAHPTPPVFDGPEDRNGTRNFDEIRFWVDYIAGADYFYDDNGNTGGLAEGSSFVIMGDYNSDPLDGDSIPGAVEGFVNNDRINNSVVPTSAGAVEANTRDGQINAEHESDPQFDTADFADTAPGNLRVDYVLPSADLEISDAGVFWPTESDAAFRLVGTYPFPSSDHRAVWVDVVLP